MILTVSVETLWIADVFDSNTALVFCTEWRGSLCMYYNTSVNPRRGHAKSIENYVKFRLPPMWSWILRFSGLLRGEGWSFKTGTQPRGCRAASLSQNRNLNKTDNVRITYHSGTFANNCCRRKAINITYLCVCVCALARPGAWACACTLIQHATRMRHVTSFVAPLAPSYFSPIW